MSDDSHEIPAAVFDDVPVFPLPGVVFLPEQRLPLHIFEPRYRAMVRDALSGAPYLVVACITGDGRHEPPPFSRVAALGRITAHQRLADGRFNILLEAVARVRLDERPFVPPYRRARAEALVDPAQPEVAPADAAALLHVMSQVLRAARARQSQLDFEAPTDLAPHRLAWRLVDRFVTSARARLSVLEASTPAVRVARATAALAEVMFDGDASPPAAKA